MKKAIAGTLVIIAILIAAPFVNGLMMEKTLLSQVEKVNKLYNNQPFSPHFEITRYERGFASSEIEAKITIPQLQNTEGFETIIVTETAKHGIFGVTSTTSLSQNSWYTDFINETLGGLEPLTMTSQFNIFSGLTNTFTLDPFDLTVDDEHFIVSPGKLIIKTDKAFKHIVADGYFEGFSADGVMDIKSCSFSSDGEMISNILMDGKSSLTIQQVSLYDGSQEAVLALSAIEGLSSLDYNEDTGKLSTSATYNIGQIVADDEKINDVSLSVGINQLDSESLQNFYDAYLNMANELMVSLSAAQGDPDLTEQIMEQQLPMIGLALLPQLEKLLKKDLQIEMTDLHMALSQGEVDGNFSIGLKKDMTLAEFAILAQQPKKLIEVFSFATNCSLPDSLISDPQDLLVPLVAGMQTGIFEQQEGKLVHQAEIKDNKLLLNGKEFVLQ